MPSPTDEVMRLYDEHAPRLYAVALRILGGDRDAASHVLESVFVDVAGGGAIDFASLLRATRDRALARRRTQSPPEVPPQEVSPRLLVERAFYDGLTVSNLAKTYSLDEELVRTMLRDGMAELRRQFAESGVK